MKTKHQPRQSSFPGPTVPELNFQYKVNFSLLGTGWEAEICYMNISEFLIYPQGLKVEPKSKRVSAGYY